jgi:hypothetical protein
MSSERLFPGHNPRAPSDPLLDQLLRKTFRFRATSPLVVYVAFVDAAERGQPFGNRLVACYTGQCRHKRP